MKKILDFINDFTEAVRKSNASAFAASAAFFMFLSFVPVIMLIASIIPYTNINFTGLDTAFSEFIPIYVINFINDIFIEYNDTSIALVSASAIITLWISGKGFWALMNGLNAAYGVRERRNFIRLRMWGSFYTIIFIVITLFALVTMVYGQVITEAILKLAPGFKPLFDFLLSFRYLYGCAIFAILFMFVYTLIPSVKLKLFAQIPGSIFSSCGWMLISYFFSVYVKYFGGFSIYGSLTTIIIMLIWLYYDVYIILLGAIINQFFGTFLAYVKKIKENKKLAKENASGSEVFEVSETSADSEEEETASD